MPAWQKPNFYHVGKICILLCFHSSSMLEPAYKRIKEAVKLKIEADNPGTISIGLDGWSNFHHGYLGYKGYYINESWERVSFTLGCAPFDERHTGINIYNKLECELVDWNLLDKTGIVLRDNAANMEAAFDHDHSILQAEGCLNHSLQLAIKDGLFALPSAAALMKKARDLVSHANQSNIFYTEFFKQQDIHGIEGRPTLKQDVVTR